MARRFHKPLLAAHPSQWPVMIPTPMAIRNWALACVADYERWELRVAGYDTDIGLHACYRVDRAIAKLPMQSTAAREYGAIVEMLERLRDRDDLMQGEYSTEAASIGSILGRIRLIELRCVE